MSLRTFTAAERQKTALLFAFFFLTIATLWLLKALRSAALLAHLGAAELPYVRLATVLVMGFVVVAYSRVVDGLARLTVARGACLLFAGTLGVFWAALQIGGATLAAERWFVWSVFIMVDVYSTVMVGIFWIYTNDVVSPKEADRLYGPIGVGGILGGVAGGALVDSLVRLTGPVHLLLLCAGLCVVCAAIVTLSERLLRPPPRPVKASKEGGVALATAGLREVARSRYLLLIVGVVMAYEFAAAMTDFVVNVVFERAFSGEVELAQMFGRLGWIVSGAALVTQVFLVPIVLPMKRLALLLPPLAMGLGTIGLAMVPVVWMAIVLSTADRGLNYSLQQAVKETLYVPLSDAQKYKGKAVIDMLFDRLGKALSALALIAVIYLVGVSIVACLAVAFAALVAWGFCAAALGHAYPTRRARASAEENGRRA